MVFTFSVLDQKNPFLGKYGQKNQNCQFKRKFGTKTNLNMRNSECSLFEFLTGNIFLGKCGPKTQNCRFKLKIGAWANSNMKNSIVMLIFSCFQLEVNLFLEICSKNQNCLLKLKFRIQINLNMQNSMVIFIFFSLEISFFVLI